MVAVPLLTPVTIPVAPTVATELLPLLHEPPPVASASVIVDPTHTLPGPVIVPAPEIVPIVTTLVVEAVPQVFVTV